MEKGLSGILEQVFIEQVIGQLEQMKFELMNDDHSRSSGNRVTQHWVREKIRQLNDLTSRFDQTPLSKNFNHLVNNRLDSFWQSHANLSKSEILFCGVLAVVENDVEAAEFLGLTLNDHLDKIVSISIKIELQPASLLRSYTLEYIKRELELPKMRVVRLK